MGETNTPILGVETHRLSPAAYNQLCNQLQAKGQPVMTKDPLEAAYLLGMQHVLQKLREGFVVGA